MGQFGANYGANYDLIVIPSAGGVDIQGSHSVPLIGEIPFKRKRRVKEFELVAQGKIIKSEHFSATGRTQRVIEGMATSKITRLYESTTSGRISKLTQRLAESLVFSRDDEKAAQHQKEANVNRFIKESKIRKLKKLFSLYKDLD